MSKQDIRDNRRKIISQEMGKKCLSSLNNRVRVIEMARFGYTLATYSRHSSLYTR